MMVISSIVYFVIALAILIAVHEWGHFIAARLVGVKVLQFSIGFGRPLLSVKGRKGTIYTLGMVPLGGFVKMLDEEEGPVAESDRHAAFNRKPLWARAWVVIAGPLMNIVLAILLLWAMYLIGVRSIAPVIGTVAPESIAAEVGLAPQDEILSLAGQPVHSWRDFQMVVVKHLGESQALSLMVGSRRSKPTVTRRLFLPMQGWQLNHRDPDLLASLGMTPYFPVLQPIVGKVMPDSPGQHAGLQNGDRVVAINDKPIRSWRQLLTLVFDHPRARLMFTVQRDDQVKQLTVMTAEREWQGKQVGFIGVTVKPQSLPKDWLRLERYRPLKAIQMALGETYELTVTSFTMIGKLVTGQVSLRNVSGPIGIAQGAGMSAQGGLSHYLSFMALISISLGVLNILPIPMLDGGHLLFYLFEACRRKPLQMKTRQRLATLGVVLLLGLTALAFYNDIDRLIHRLSTPQAGS